MENLNTHTDTDRNPDIDYERDQQQQRNDQWQLDIPDPTTLHGERNDHSSDTRTQDTGPKHYPHKDVAYYACPFCTYRDPTERVVRAHITRADDAAHQNRNAFVDAIYVQAMADDDTIVEDVDAPGATRYTSSDSDTDDDEVTFLPEGVDPDSRAADILDAAIKAPLAAPADLAEEIYGDRTQMSHITRVITQYLRTPSETETEMEPKNDTDAQPSDPRVTATGFDDRTEKQQRVILARLDDLDPERSLASIAEAASVSSSYPKAVLINHEATIDELRALLDADTEAGEKGDEESLTLEALAAHADLDQPEALTLTSIESTDDSAGAGAEDSPADTDDNADEHLDDQSALTAFEDATGKQQAVLLAWLVDPDPDRPMASVHRLAGVSQGYASQVLEQYEAAVAALGVLIEQDDLSLDALLERAAIDHETSLADGNLDDLSTLAPSEEQAVSDSDSSGVAASEQEGDAEADRDTQHEIETGADTDAAADTTAESEIETASASAGEADPDEVDSDAPITELARTLTVLEDAARADVAGTSPGSTVHAAAQRQLYTIRLVQDCLDRMDPAIDADLDLTGDTESAIADGCGGELSADDPPADTLC